MTESFEDARRKMDDAAKFRQWRDLDPGSAERKVHGPGAYKELGSDAPIGAAPTEPAKGPFREAGASETSPVAPASDAEIEAAVRSAIAQADLEA